MEDTSLLNNTAFSISGGGTNFCSLAAMALVAKSKGIHPKVIIGVSAGAVMAVPLALHMHQQIEDFAKNVTNDQIFKVSPVNKKGKISFKAIFRALTGKNSFGVQDIKPLIKEVVTKRIFEVYKNGNYADVYILAVDFDKGKRTVFKVKDLTYEQYLQAVSASSRIPVMTQPEIIENVAYYDGGLRDHNAANFLLEYLPEINHLVSFYSRPQNYVVERLNSSENIMSVISRTIEILNIELSKNDEYKEKEFCKNRGIKLDQLFAPERAHFYNTDKKELSRLYKLAKEYALNYFKNNTDEPI